MEAVTGHVVILDYDVQRILEIMQTTVPTEKLTGVAEAVRDVGRLLWAHHESVTVDGIRLVAEPLTIACEKQSAASV
jgi:hypothetical protein